MDNKVTFGLEQVHVAFSGVAQVEKIAVTHECTTDGEITVTVTAGTILGASSPKAVVVPLATETHSDVTKVASAVVNALNNDAVISAKFLARNVLGVIYLEARAAAANDATLAIAFTVGSTGVTAGSSSDVEAGSTGYGTPIAIPGAIGFTPKAQGQEKTFYADNGIYFSATSNNGYTADLEMALIPDSVLALMLNWLIDNNGALVEIADALPAHFALMGQVQGDAKNRRFVYYDCVAARPEKEAKTKGETIDPQSDKLSLTITPVTMTVGGEQKSVTKAQIELSDTNATAYNGFFSSVYVPVVS